MSRELPRHSAIVLAAGTSSRLGQPKALLRLGGVSLVRHVASDAGSTSPLELVVVVGSEPKVAQQVERIATRIVNVEPSDEGMAASLRAGLAALTQPCDGLLVLLCDQPALTGRHLALLLGEWHEQPALAVATGYAGVRGVPAILPASWFDALRALRGDRGARELLRTREDVRVIVDEAYARDIDTLDDLA